MGKVLWATLVVVTLLTALPAFAQNPNYDAGPVWRVSYYHIKPGQAEAFSLDRVSARGWQYGLDGGWLVGFGILWHSTPG